MRRSTPTRDSHPSPLRGALLALCLLFAAGTVVAQDPIPTAADPDMAEQETYGLVVKVSGSNFGTDSQVDFLVNGSETDTGGITVRNVNRRNPKTLEVTIDVAPDAQFLKKFDIRVRSNGRTGKGTELFRVLEKPNPGGGWDTTPPDDVIDLTLVGEPMLQPEGDYMATFRWTSPYDDSGAIYVSWLKARPGALFPIESWEEEMTNWYAHPRYPVGWPQPPGSIQDAYLRSLAPETCYTSAMRSADGVFDGPPGNWSGLSNTVTFCTGPPGASSWEQETLDSCPTFASSLRTDLEYGSDGEPAVAYHRGCLGDERVLFTRRTASGWTTPVPVPVNGDMAVHPVSGLAVVLAQEGGNTDPVVLWSWDGNAWLREVIDADPKARGISNLSYFLDPDTGGAVLAVAYRARSKNKRIEYLRLATRRDGQGWEKHDLIVAGIGAPTIAFDSSGNVGVIYPADVDAYQSGVTSFALWDGNVWLGQVAVAPESPWSCSPDSLTWSRHFGEFWLSDRCYDPGAQFPTWSHRIRVCRQPATSWPAWSCETVQETETGAGSTIAVADDGTAYLATEVPAIPGQRFGHTMLQLWTRPDETSPWAMESVDWTCGWGDSRGLRIEPHTQRPSIAYFAQLRPQATWLLTRLP